MRRTRLFERFVEDAEGPRLTMVALGEKVGYTPEHLSRIRWGRYPITDDFVARVCFRLGEREAALFYDDGVGEGEEVPAEMRAPPLPASRR